MCPISGSLFLAPHQRTTGEFRKEFAPLTLAFAFLKYYHSDLPEAKNRSNSSSRKRKWGRFHRRPLAVYTEELAKYTEEKAYPLHTEKPKVANRRKVNDNREKGRKISIFH